MKLSVALVALVAFPTFVTSIPLLDSVNDGYVNVTRRHNERSVDKRQLSSDMFAIVNAIRVYADEYNSYRGYSRSDFTQNVVEALRNFNPHFNYIICHSDHDYDFGSPWGVNVYNVWVTYDQSVLGFTNPPGFDVVIGKNGTFIRYGEGGFDNWAYNGNIISTQNVYNGYRYPAVLVTFGIPN